MKLCYSLLGVALVALLGATGPARAQSSTTTFGLVPASVAKVVQGADTLAQAWAGGLNTPQFSAVDLNNDGRLDLYVFERETNRSFPFLNVAAGSGGGRRYQYAPDYAALFPTDLYGWALLRDYDCDARPDLFTYANGGNIRVFRNVVGAGGGTSFVLANPMVTYLFQNVTRVDTVNINIGPYNLPAIDDFNGDGKLDLLSYDFIDSTLLGLYLNTSTESCGGFSNFNYVSSYWGQVRSCYDCATYRLQGATACTAYRTQHTTGHNVLLLDLNGDGKLDLLDGRDNCPKLSRLLNSGSSLTNATFAAADVTSQWPSASAPVNLPVFPAPYRLDADFDGVPDLVIAPNMVDNSLDRVSMRNNVRLYHNGAANASAVPSYTLTNSSFLQQDMLDVSEGAMPAFGDLDGDGLTDMLVGNAGDLVNGYYRASLSYYRNVGSAHRPVFRLQDADYLGLAAAAQASNTRLEQLRPALVDLNRDGVVDLVYSAYDGTTAHLYYLVNQATTGQPSAFNVAQRSYFHVAGTTQLTGLPDTAGDTPCFFDVDGDGYVDLLLGTNQAVGTTTAPGSLRYFRNRGAAGGGNLDNLFTLSNGDYGQLRYSTGMPPGVTPAVADFDGDGTPDLLVMNSYGLVTLYSNFRRQNGNFLGRSDLFYNDLLGQYTTARLGNGPYLRFAATTADLNQDGQPELYLGTESGGILSFLTQSRTVLAAHSATAATLAFSLYPNPATQTATAETAHPTSLRLLDLTGRQVLADATLARTHQLDLRGLAAGIYVAQATAADGTTTTLKLVVQ